MPSPLALVPSFVSGARDVVSPVEEAENGLADRQREREKRKEAEEGGNRDRRKTARAAASTLVYVSESSGCLNGDTFTRAASYGGKADLSAPTIPFPFSSLLGSRFPPRAAAPLPPASLFVRPPPHSLSPSRSVAFRRPSNPFTKRIVSYTGIFHFPVFSSGPVKSNLRESRLLTRAIQCERVDEGGMRIPVDFFWNL